jgi:RimJ/RimL family protein N-acetyltransferase
MIGLVGTKGNGDELVYMIHCDYWKKGYMTEALNAFGGPEGVFWRLPSD